MISSSPPLAEGRGTAREARVVEGPAAQPTVHTLRFAPGPSTAFGGPPPE